MHLTFTPTDLAGCVIIKGDNATISKVENLLKITALNSHVCDDNGMCMILSLFFEKQNQLVDWVTLVSGVSALRNSLGYRLSKEDHAIVCLLEYLTFDALCTTLPELPETIEAKLSSFTYIPKK
jgi:hypothetical protein